MSVVMVAHGDGMITAHVICSQLSIGYTYIYNKNVNSCNVSLSTVVLNSRDR